MKSFLNDYMPWLIFGDIVIMMGSVFTMFIVSVLSKKKYEIIVDKYTEKFGSIPLLAAMSKEASFIGTPSLYGGKIAFITNSLVYPYCRLMHPQMTREQYSFIRELPSNLTFIFKVQEWLFILTAISLVLMLFLCQYI
ncbi:MAG TPA: hypothetical protein VJY99_16385 [Buttiauxella sp.]|uniref:hypothetical protein n=1 Tax=Buttiauxella sp. TaxID=1972222 RepID=UPI002B46D3D1|nr:hypothetical protein [Buttiauxella sp.]HKM98249.1 hypothetical protein [Buttiauxella sp.]